MYSCNTLTFKNLCLDIYSFSTKAPFALNAPIYLESNGISQLTFDWKNRELIAVDFVKQTNSYRFILFPVDNPNLGPKISILPSGIKGGQGAFDPQRAEYYNLAPINQTQGQMTVLNVTTGTKIRELTTDCIVDKLWVEDKVIG